jgi:hypothetical protein
VLQIVVGPICQMGVHGMLSLPNSYQVYPGIQLLVACAWSPLFKELRSPRPLTQKSPVQGLLVVQIFVFLMVLTFSCRRSSRWWGLPSVGGRKPLRMCVLCSGARGLPETMVL